jgi:hypothetical protein
MWRCLVFCAFSLAPAAEPVALWSFGSGTRAGQPVASGAVIDTGDTLTIGPAPVRVELLGFPGSDLCLSPGSSLSLSRDPAVPGRLVVDLLAGRLAVDLRGSGATNHIVVRSTALNVRGHDCQFLIERLATDADYVAVISGQVLAGLQPGLTSTDGGMALLLQARQGLHCSSADGLAEVDHLRGRPHLLLPAAMQEQGQKHGDQAAWQHDDAAAATDDPPNDGTLTLMPVVLAVVTPTPEPPPVITPQPELPVAVVVIPPPPVESPVTHQARPGTALIDALADDAWQRRGRSSFLRNR